jgi:electron transport complex protein RnfG
MLRTMVGIGLVCGVLIVTTYEATKPVIARNRAEALEAAIFQVLPAASSSKAFQLGDSGGFTPLEGPAPAGATLVHAAYDEAGALVGLAVEGAGMGYQDTIRILWGYEPGEEIVVGMQVLESKETPGLGDKIASDAGFQENFARLDVTLSADGAGLVNPVVAVKHGAKADPWQVDGITGATVSSVAVSRILDESAGFWLPRIRRNLDTFQEGAH